VKQLEAQDNGGLENIWFIIGNQSSGALLGCWKIGNHCLL